MSSPRRRELLIPLVLGLGGCVEIDPRFYLGNECDEKRSGVVFCTGFEEGNLDLWDDDDLNPNEMNDVVPDDGPLGLTGNHVMRLRPAPDTDERADMVKQLPGFYDELYARWYVKLESGYDLDVSAALWPGLHAGGHDILGTSDSLPSGDDRFTVLLSHDIATHRLITKLDYRGMYQDCSNPNGGCFRDELPCMRDEGESWCIKPQHRETTPAVAVEKERWYCIELFVDAGTPVTSDADADGKVAFWLDGEPMDEFTDLWFRTVPSLKIDIFWLSEFTGPDHGDEGVLYDDIVVSRERIGCQ